MRLGLVFVVLLLGTAVTLLALYTSQIKAEQAAFQEREAALALELEQLKTEYEARTDYLHKLENDPDYLERVVRARFGYGRQDETIIRFERDRP